MDNSNEILVDVVDPHFQRRILLSRSTWDDHVIASTGKRIGHTIMEGNEAAVSDSLENPNTIFKSDRGNNRYVYIKRNAVGATYSPALLTNVVVEFNGNVGDVKTAFPSSRIGGVTDLVYANIKRGL